MQRGSKYTAGLLGFIGLFAFGYGVFHAETLVARLVAAATREVHYDNDIQHDGKALVMLMSDVGNVSMELQELSYGGRSAFVPGSSLELAAGKYLIKTSSDTSGILTYAGDCDPQGILSVSEHDTSVCMVRITEKVPEGTLVLHGFVVNDDLGDAIASDFFVYRKAADLYLDLTWGVATTVPAGVEQIVLDGRLGYDVRISGDCDASGNVTIRPGKRAECTFTMDDETPHDGLLSVKTDPIDGGLGVEDVEVRVNGEPLESEEGISLLPAGTYQLEAIDSRGNNLRLAGDCSPEGKVLVRAGKEVTCLVSSSMFSQVTPGTEG